MTADKRKGLNSVRYVNNPISKPGCNREKASQVGGSLTVSHVRPTFCQFCKVRHGFEVKSKSKRWERHDDML